MNKSIKKFFIVLIVFIIAFSINNYAYEQWSATGLNGNEDREYYGEVVFSEKTRNVKMTQDDDYYYFDIEQDIVAPFSDSNYINTRRSGTSIAYTTFDNGNKMQIVLAPFSNICQLSHQRIDSDSSYLEQSGFNKGSDCFYTYADKGRVYVSGTYKRYFAVRNNDIRYYSSDGRSYPMCYFISNAGNSTGIRGQVNFTGWVERNGTGGPNTISGYVPYNIPKINDSDPDIALTSPQVLSQSCECVTYRQSVSSGSLYNEVKELECIFRYKIKIKKDNLNVFDSTGNCVSPFRYCNVTSKGNFDNATGSRIYPYCTSINNSIDLSQYLDCDHNFIYTGESTKEYHKVYCEKCNWIKKENHDLKYEYDGIEDNLCKCGYVNKVKYHFIINDNINTERIDILDSFEDYEKLEGGLKTGYNLNGYEKYEMQIATLSDISTTHTKLVKIRLDDCMTMTDKTGNYSTYYIAKYNPIHYFIKFNVKNNKNFALDSAVMPTQEFIYDEEQELFDNWIVNGYMITGWYDSEAFNHKLFDRKGKVLNYTTIENDVIEIFPYFDETCFYINYIYSYGDFRGQNPQKVLYFDNQKLADISTPDRSILFSGWLFNNKGAKIDEIKEYITYQNQNVYLYAVYYANTKANEVPKEGIDPSGRNYNKKGKNGILDGLSEIGDGLYTNKEYVDKFVAIASSSIIATKSEIATESIIIVPKSNNKRIIMLDTNYFVYEIPKISGLERLMIIMKVNLFYTCLAICIILCLLIGYVRYMITHPINETIGGINENIKNIKKYFKEWLQSKSIGKNTIEENDNLIDNENIDNIEG